jgi:hypothetical protein
MEKLTKAQKQQIYRDKLKNDPALKEKYELIKATKANANRIKYQTDINYKNYTNKQNNNRYHSIKFKATQYDILITQNNTNIVSLQPVTTLHIIPDTHNIDIVQPVQNSDIDIVQPVQNSDIDIVQPVQNIDIVQNTDIVQPVQNIQNIQPTETSNLPKNHILCTHCNKSYIKYYFNKHLLSKKHLKHSQNI